MLTSVKVSGFRSLNQFDLEIKPGLNVLVGPNGAGKTNIILFFEFLRSIIGQTVSDSIGKAGGIAQVFTKKGEKKFATEINADLSGEIEVEEIKYSYRYTFVICFNQTKQELSFTKQQIQINKIAPDGTSVHFSARVEENESGELVSSLSFPSDKYKKHLSDQFKDLTKRGIFQARSVVVFMQFRDPVCEAVSMDLSSRFVLNVVPSHVKKPEDSTRPPGIESDGSGLSATLYAIKKKKPFYEDGPIHRSVNRDPISPNWKSVLDVIRVAVPTIQDMDVTSDPFDNLLKCKVTIGRGAKKSSVLPLSSLSDGTVKWISLVLRLSTSKAALLLEEPENYLHPLMQREIVRLLRDAISSSGFMLVSTHSETLLNSVRAEELIIVQYSTKGTTAKRVENSEDVENEINRTGFGLGYYYLTDSMETA